MRLPSLQKLPNITLSVISAEATPLPHEAAALLLS